MTMSAERKIMRILEFSLSGFQVIMPHAPHVGLRNRLFFCIPSLARSRKPS
jgi:hypothetical protein